MRMPITLALLLSLSSLTYGQSTSLCGTAPPVANETLKGEIVGKAQLLTRFVGDAQLSGKIETSRTEIFSKYPDAELSRSNAFFEYQVCVLVMSDTTKTAEQKIRALTEIRREFHKPVVREFTAIIRPRGSVYKVGRLGIVDALISRVTLKIDDKRVLTHQLDSPFGNHRIKLKEGEHTFEYVVSVWTRGGADGLHVNDSCMGTFAIAESGIFNPSLTFEARNQSDGRTTECSLEAQD